MHLMGSKSIFCYIDQINKLYCSYLKFNICLILIPLIKKKKKNSNLVLIFFLFLKRNILVSWSIILFTCTNDIPSTNLPGPRHLFFSFFNGDPIFFFFFNYESNSTKSNHIFLLPTRKSPILKDQNGTNFFFFFLNNGNPIF